jgi:hypothetical protein
LKLFGWVLVKVDVQKSEVLIFNRRCQQIDADERRFNLFLFAVSHNLSFYTANNDFPKLGIRGTIDENGRPVPRSFDIDRN